MSKEAYLVFDETLLAMRIDIEEWDGEGYVAESQSYPVPAHHFGVFRDLLLGADYAAVDEADWPGWIRDIVAGTA